MTQAKKLRSPRVWGSSTKPALKVSTDPGTIVYEIRLLSVREVTDCTQVGAAFSRLLPMLL